MSKSQWPWNIASKDLFNFDPNYQQKTVSESFFDEHIKINGALCGENFDNL